MHVLIISPSFVPEITPSAHLFLELGPRLIARGHDVTILTGYPQYNVENLGAARHRSRRYEIVEGMRVVRGWRPVWPRHIPFVRGADYLLSAGVLGAKALGVERADVSLVYSPPLPLALVAQALRTVRHVPYILYVQDLFPQSVIDLGLLRNRVAIGFLRWMERQAYRAADCVAVHSEGNRRHVLAKAEANGAADVRVIPNWVDTKFIVPGPRDNEFRTVHGLGDDFVVSFAGTMGYSQDLDTVLRAAAIVQHTVPTATFLLIGEGVEKERIQRAAKTMVLDNVRFIPMLPRADYPALLRASDVCLVPLRRCVTTPVVPSKVYSIMAAGRPVVASAGRDGDLPRIVEDAGCGIAVEPERPSALAGAIIRLYQDPAGRERFGAKGREVAESRYSVDVCTTMYEELFSEVVARASQRAKRRGDHA